LLCAAQPSAAKEIFEGCDGNENAGLDVHRDGVPREHFVGIASDGFRQEAQAPFHCGSVGQRSFDAILPDVRGRNADFDHWRGL